MCITVSDCGYLNLHKWNLMFFKETQLDLLMSHSVLETLCVC